MASRVKAAIAAMSIEQLQCRDFGHSWRGYTAKRLPKGRFESILHCPRCDTLRVRILSNTGEVLGNHYRYRADYRIQGLGKLTAEDRGAFRLAAVMASMPERAGLRAVPS